MDKLRANYKKWQICLDIMQASCLLGIFIGIMVLENLPRETAQSAVWYWAGAEILLVFLTYLVQRQSDKARRAYFTNLPTILQK